MVYKGFFYYSAFICFRHCIRKFYFLSCLLAWLETIYSLSQILHEYKAWWVVEWIAIWIPCVWEDMCGNQPWLYKHAEGIRYIHRHFFLNNSCFVFGSGRPYKPLVYIMNFTNGLNIQVWQTKTQDKLNQESIIRFGDLKLSFPCIEFNCN